MVAEVVEAIWTFTAVLGIAGSGVMLYITHLQSLALKGAVNGRRRQLRKNVRNEVSRALVFAIILAIGVFALATPNDPTNAVSLIAYLFILMAAILMVNVILDALMALQDMTGGFGVDRRESSGDAERDVERDERRDPVRDAARDVEHDKEIRA